MKSYLRALFMLVALLLSALVWAVGYPLIKLWHWLKP